jgi:hypothetical protein
MIAGNTIDVGARNAEVVKLAVVERSEFTNGLLVSGPLLKGLTDVHRVSPVVYVIIFSGWRKNEQSGFYQISHALFAGQNATKVLVQLAARKIESAATDRTAI